MGREVKIELFDPGADAEAVDQLTGDLRLELLELDVDSVSPVSAGPAPEGSKGVELFAVGELLVQVKDHLPLVTAVVTAVRVWLQRSPSSGRSLKVTVDGRTLELTAASAKEQRQIVTEFVRALGS